MRLSRTTDLSSPFLAYSDRWWDSGILNSGDTISIHCQFWGHHIYPLPKYTTCRPGSEEPVSR